MHKNDNFLRMLVCSIFAILALFSCSEQGKNIGEPEFDFSISGKVIDTGGYPIYNAKVLFDSGNDKGETTTDPNGLYRIVHVDLGEYRIDVSKPGYTYKTAYATVTENGAYVGNIILKNLSIIKERIEKETTAEEIFESGLDISSVVVDSFSMGGVTVEQTLQQVAASIPPKTEIKVSGQVPEEKVSLAVAPLEVDDIPPASGSEMPIGAVLFEPLDAEFDKPVEVVIPVEMQLPEGTKIPLKKYEDGSWKAIGTAVVDESGIGAHSGITEFGQYAIQPNVQIESSSEEPQETRDEPQEIPQDQNTVEVEITDTIDFPGGLPTGVTVEYAYSLIEKIKGINAGTTKNLTIELPNVSEAAKSASLFSTDSAETWIQTCNLIIVNIITNESISVTIDIGGSIYPFTLDYTYTRRIPQIECTQKWVEHNQGGIN